MARSTRSPSRKASSSRKAIRWSRSIRGRSRPPSIRPRPRRPRTKPISPTPISTCSAITKLGEFATRQQTDTQRSTVAQLTAQIEADAAAISNAQTQLDYATVKAPISGVAGLRQVDVGNIVNAATQTGIVTIAQIEPIAVIFTAPEDQLPDIKAALAVGAAEDDRAVDRRQARAVDGNAGADQQPGRHHQRHDPAQGGVRQQGPCAVAGPVGFDPAADRDAEGRHRGSRRCGPARHRRPLRLHGQPGQQGRAAQDQGDALDRRALGDR